MNIKEIKDSKFLKNMKNDELEALANDIRHFLLDNVSKTGGHLSSNLGSVELIIALHKSFDLDNDKLLFDVGHQAYTHKILTGRADKFDTLRQIDGLSGFLSNEESKYDVFESGHSSTSLSTAMGMAKARDNDRLNYEIVSIIGDASIANGISFEALNNLSNQNNKVIIVLNDNDMSINKSVGAIAKQLSNVRSSKSYAKFKIWFEKTFKKHPKFVNFVHRCIHRIALIFRSDNMFDNFKVSYLGPVDGHNFKKLEKAFNKAKSYPESILVHVKTKKGKGYKYAEDDKTGKFHGIKPFDLATGEVIEQDINNEKSFTEEIASVIYEELKNNKQAYLISSAMYDTTKMGNCFIDFPSNCIDVGIAEEHSISLANGLALANKYPYVSIYSTFLQRGYDQIVHDVARINSNVTFLVDRSGIVGEDGKTHQGVFDVSMVYPLDNTIIAMPSEIKYVRPLFECLKQVNGPKFIRYQKLSTSIEDNTHTIHFGRFIEEIYDESYEKTIIAVGHSCYKLKQLILQNNLKINLINPIFLKPIDIDCLNKIINTKIYVYDNTSLFEGFTSQILDYYSKNNKSIEAFTLPNSYIKHGKYQDILKYLSLDEEYILNKVINDE